MKHRMWLVGILLLALVVSASAQTLVENCDLGPNGEWTWDHEIYLCFGSVYYLKADPDWFPDPGDTKWDCMPLGGGSMVFSGVHITRPSPVDYQFTVPANGYYSFHGLNLTNEAIRVNLFKIQ